MNTLIQYLKNFICPAPVAFWLLTISGLNGLHQPVFAQKSEHPILQTTQNRTDSNQAYWQLKTLADTRTTVVRFFGPDHKLIYQETLPEKWIKPTRRNRRQFDRLLKELLAHELVSTRIKTESLPTFLPEPRLAKPQPNLTVNRQIEPSADAPYTVNAFVNQKGKLRLLVDNPLRQRYRIELKDERGHSLYREYCSIGQYRRKLDVSELGSGKHSLAVFIGGQVVRYELKNRRAVRIYELQPLASVQR